MLTLVGKNGARASALDGLRRHVSQGRSRFLMKGDLVEVKQCLKGLRGSWHPAIVVEVFAGRRVVEYTELLTPNGLGKLRETVHVNELRLGLKTLRATVLTGRSRQHIRPRPPPAPIVSLPLERWIHGTWVDCLYQDAWWEGILKEVLTSASSKTTCLVSFPDEEDISEHDIKSLRLTQDWDERSGTWNRRVPLPVHSDLNKQLVDVANYREGADRIRDEKNRGCSRTEPLPNISSSVTRFPNEGEHCTDGSGTTIVDNIDERKGTLSPLSLALSYYAEVNDKGHGTGSATSNCENQDTSLTSPEDQGNSNSCMGMNTAIVLRSEVNTVSYFHVDLTEGDARVFLKEMGWDVTKIVRQNGNPRWIYKAPPVNMSPASVFHSLCGALEEYNRKIRSIPQGADIAKETIGLLRKRKASTKSKVRGEENLTSNKRLRRSVEKKQEVGFGEEVQYEQKLNDFKPSTKAGSPCLSSSDETDHPDGSPADSRMGSSDSGTAFNERHVKVDIHQAREYLRAAGWEVGEVLRKCRNAYDWYYKAPATGIYRAASFQSLCGAIPEYNRRVRSHNNNRMQNKPTILLTRRNGRSRALSPKVDEVKLACTKMDGTQKNPSCRNGITAFKPRSSRRLSNKQGKCLSSEGADFQDDLGFASHHRKTSGNFLESPAAAAKSGDAKRIMGGTFGTFAGGVLENDRGYVLQVNVLNLKKEELRISIEKDNLIIKATYCAERRNSKFSTTCSGSLSCKLTLPMDAVKESVTATQLKPGILHLTIPKKTKTRAKFEIPIV